MRDLLSSCLIACGLLLASVASAQELGLYEAEVPVNSQDATERNTALPRALAQVIVKLTGDAGAPRHPDVAAQLRDARNLMQQYRYRPDTETATGAPSYRQFLIAGFDHAAVDAIIAAAGLPSWPEPRVTPVLWLAIDDGRGARLVGATQTNVVMPLTRRGVERGLDFTLPQGSTIEQAGVDSVWRLDGAAITTLTTRYHSAASLLGKLYRDNGGWTADWLLMEDGVELGRWSVSDTDARRAIASGADGAADALAAAHAKVVEAGPPAVVNVAFRGVRGADDYLRLMGYLQNLAVVRGIVPQLATPDVLRFRLELATGLAGFTGLVAAGDVLVPASDTDGTLDGVEAIFDLRPSASP